MTGSAHDTSLLAASCALIQRGRRHLLLSLPTHLGSHDFICRHFTASPSGDRTWPRLQMEAPTGHVRRAVPGRSIGEAPRLVLTGFLITQDLLHDVGGNLPPLIVGRSGSAGSSLQSPSGRASVRPGEGGRNARSQGGHDLSRRARNLHRDVHPAGRSPLVSPRFLRSWIIGHQGNGHGLVLRARIFRRLSPSKNASFSAAVTPPSAPNTL